MIKISCKLVYL